jgi:hypothetical protein
MAAAAALDEAREVGRQLDLFASRPAPVEDAGEAPRGPGRPKGSRNRVKVGLAEMLAHQGYRAPAEVLAHLAGLHVREDPFLVAIGRAQALLTAAGGEAEGPMLVDTALRILREQRQAADALAPYVHPKVSPDGAPAAPMVVQIAAGLGVQVGASARVGPPPLPVGESERDQGVGEGDG